MLSQRENYLRAALFGTPERIPVHMRISEAAWIHYREALEPLLLKRPDLVGGYRKGSVDFDNLDVVPWRRVGSPYTDSWGCVWETVQQGFTGSVTRHGLENWDDFERFTPPDPAHHSGWGEVDWETVREKMRENKRNGSLVTGGLRHGHLFLTLTYLRGYQNLIFDMHDQVPELLRLIEMVENFSAEIVRRYIDFDADVIAFPEDLGMQKGLMLTPGQFRQYIKPSYQRLMALAKDSGRLVQMHSDGDVMELADDLLECGVDVLNIQDLVNGVDEIARRLKGRVCIELDIDRQRVTRFGTPGDIDDLIHEEVETLGSREGGLMLIYDLCPGIPLENIDAVMGAMEKYSTYYA